MCVCRKGNDGYTYDDVYNRDKLWRYKFQDLLHDGNTVVLRYSRACYQCGDMEDDKSDHCHDNSIIIQVNAIEDSDLFRIDVAVPGFQNDPNIISDRYGKFSDYKSFVISSKPHEYDFSKPVEEIMAEVGSLYNKERTHAVESMLGLYNVYLSLLLTTSLMTGNSCVWMPRQRLALVIWSLICRRSPIISLMLVMGLVI